MVLAPNAATDLQQQDPWCFRPCDSSDICSWEEISDGESPKVEGVSPLSLGVWSGVGKPHQA